MTGGERGSARRQAAVDRMAALGRWPAGSPGMRLPRGLMAGLPALTAMAVLAALSGLAGCGDGGGDGLDPVDFAITVTVRDADGEPVAGLRAGLSPALPESLVRVSPGWLEAGPRRDLPDPEHERQVTVRDVAGRFVWRESHTGPVYWPAVDAAGNRVHDGWYELETILTSLHDPTDADTTIAPVIVYSGADPDIYLAGVTDAHGSFTVTDRTFVPAFWNPEPVPAGDEAGEATITLTRETWLRLLDDHGAEQWATFTAIDGLQTVEVEWSPFRVELQVTDPTGAPVPGLQVVVMPALPDWLWPDPTDRAQIVFRFAIAADADVSVIVHDVRGERVRGLVDGLMTAGHWTVVWNGRDDAGRPVPSGWYRIVLAVHDPVTGELLHTQDRPLVLADDDPALAVATTDAQGRAVLVDRRLVPGLWDLDPIVAVDEEGDEIGEFTLTAETWIRLVDDTGRDRWWSGAIADGPQEIAITWQP